MVWKTKEYMHSLHFLKDHFYMRIQFIHRVLLHLHVLFSSAFFQDIYWKLELALEVDLLETKSFVYVPVKSIWEAIV